MIQWPGEKYGYFLVCLSVGECGVFVTIVPWLLHSFEAGDRIKKQNKKRRKGKKKGNQQKTGNVKKYLAKYKFSDPNYSFCFGNIMVCGTCTRYSLRAFKLETHICLRSKSKTHCSLQYFFVTIRL